jgi:hypothetical protein
MKTCLTPDYYSSGISAADFEAMSDACILKEKRKPAERGEGNLLF